MDNGLERFGSIKDLTKEELHVLAVKDAKHLMDSGNHNATALAVSARKALEYLGAFMRTLDSNVIDEIEMNNGKVVVLGSTLELGSTGDRLDFEKDAIYKNLSMQLKARAELLKHASKDTIPVVDANGEVVEPVPIKSASRTMIKCKL